MSITQELIKILRWGFHCLTSMALNCLLRWFIMVLAVFGVSPIFWPIFQQQLSLASINGVVCHCLKVIWAPSTWSPRLHPITVLSLHLKGPRALTWFLLPPHHSPPLKPVQISRGRLSGHATPVPCTSDQSSRQSRCGIYWERGFPSTQYKLAQLVSRCY